MYASLARWAFRRGKVVIAAWIIILFGVNAIAGAIGTAFSAEFSTPESESTRGFAVLNEHFPGSSSAFSGNIVFKAEQMKPQSDSSMPLQPSTTPEQT